MAHKPPVMLRAVPVTVYSICYGTEDVSAPGSDVDCYIIIRNSLGFILPVVNSGILVTGLFFNEVAYTTYDVSCFVK
jgi:hypothetical protein